MAAVHNVGFSYFLIFKFLVADRIEMTNVHRYTSFVKIDQTVLAISPFFILNMAAIHHLGFSNFQTFGHTSGWDG